MPRIMVLRRGSDRFFPLMDVSGVSLLPVLAIPLLLGILLGTVFGVFSETLPASLNSSAFFSETGYTARSIMVILSITLCLPFSRMMPFTDSASARWT